MHLSTTDPAAHLAGTLNGDLPGLKLSRIDPKVETQRYIDKIMAAKSPHLDTQQQALLLEDLQSPCTDEVAVFHAFSRIVSEGRSAFVVLDTAPTGHSMLLMDATGAYHRQMTREFEGHGATRVVTPLMRLQDGAYTKIILVTLPEVTPVSQAAALQDDLRRAHIEPMPGCSTRAFWRRAHTTPCCRRGWPANASRSRACPQGWPSVSMGCRGWPLHQSALRPCRTWSLHPPEVRNSEEAARCRPHRTLFVLEQTPRRCPPTVV